MQTAYANGAATAYLRDVLQLPVTCTPTGACGRRSYGRAPADTEDVCAHLASMTHGFDISLTACNWQRGPGKVSMHATSRTGRCRS